MFKKLVIWGGNEGGFESHRHIHRAFHENALKLGINAVWVPNVTDSNFAIEQGSTVITADIYSAYLYYHPGVDYVLHNFNGDHFLFQQADPERILRLQVWTTDAFGDHWERYRQYSYDGRILFQPWGTDLLAEEFMEPVWNPASKEVVFVGAVWSDIRDGVELGNIEAIDGLRNALLKRGLVFSHHTQISDIDMVAFTRRARFAPVVVGNWQCEHGYLPCRAFKHASWGVPVMSNSPYVCDLLKLEPGADTIEDMIDSALTWSWPEVQDWVSADQEIAKSYTYRESLEAIATALEEGR